jgi:hypothetical protein
MSSSCLAITSISSTSLALLNGFREMIAVPYVKNKSHSSKPLQLLHLLTIDGNASRIEKYIYHLGLIYFQPFKLRLFS